MYEMDTSIQIIRTPDRSLPGDNCEKKFYGGGWFPALKKPTSVGDHIVW